MATDDNDIDDELLSEQAKAGAPAAEIESDNDAAVVGGLDENIAGALAYLFAPLLAIVLYLIEEDSTFVRFHAVQSLIVFGGLICLYIGLTVFGLFFDFIPVLGAFFGIFTFLIFMLLVPVSFVLWLVLTIKAYKGDEDGLPVVGDMAKGYV